MDDALQTYSYAWWDGAVQSSIGNDKNWTGGTPSIDWTTAYTLDASGHVSSVFIDDGRDRTVSFIVDQNARIAHRDENDTQSGGDPRTLRYLFAGQQLGAVTNNGTDNMQYVASIRDRLIPLATNDKDGAFRGGSKTARPYADFEQSYDAINGGVLDDTGAAYTASEGDTLQSIALAIWGDASLWYLIAEANGLTNASQLAAGQRIALPNKVRNSHNNAETFRPYDPNEALGNLSPTSPKPTKKPKCAVVGQILMVAIAVAVSVATAGAAAAAMGAANGVLGGIGALASGFSAVTGTALAATTTIAAGAIGGAVGSLASQAFGVATGLQDKFSWKGVAMAAISGAIGGGMGPGKLFGTSMGNVSGGAFSGLGTSVGAKIAAGALRGLVGSALGQGIGVATGLQNKLDWAGVAAAGIAGGVTAGLGSQMQSVNTHAAGLVSGAAGAIASSAAGSIMTGSSFGDNLMASLPGVIGSTLGNMVVDAISGRPVFAGRPRVDVEQDGGGPSEAGFDISLAPRRASALERAVSGSILDVDDRLSIGSSISEAGIGGNFAWLECQAPSIAGSGATRSIATEGYPSAGIDGYKSMSAYFAELQPRLENASDRETERANMARHLATNYILERFVSREGRPALELTPGNLQQSLADLSLSLMNFRGDATLDNLDSGFSSISYTGVVRPLLRDLGSDATFGALFRVVADNTEEMYARYQRSPEYQAAEERGRHAERVFLAGHAIMSLPLVVEGVLAPFEGGLLLRGLATAATVAEGDLVTTSLSAPLTGNDQSLLARGIDSVIPGGHGQNVVNVLNLAAPATLVGSLSRSVLQRIRSSSNLRFMRSEAELAAEAAAARAAREIEEGSNVVVTASRSRVRARPLEVNTFGDLAPRSIGDGLSPDHIPSLAAIRARTEALTGRRLTQTQLRQLRKDTNAIMIDTDIHREFSRTFGGRNTRARINEDALDLAAAVARDRAALEPGLRARGYSQAEIARAFDRLDAVNRAKGLY